MKNAFTNIETVKDLKLLKQESKIENQRNITKTKTNESTYFILNREIDEVSINQYSIWRRQRRVVREEKRSRNIWPTRLTINQKPLSSGNTHLERRCSLTGFWEASLYSNLSY